jgi:hypothetical protein
MMVSGWSDKWGNPAVKLPQTGDIITGTHGRLQLTDQLADQKVLFYGLPIFSGKNINYETSKRIIHFIQWSTSRH